jgi:hypothetical protein
MAVTRRRGWSCGRSGTGDNGLGRQAVQDRLGGPKPDPPLGGDRYLKSNVSDFRFDVEVADISGDLAHTMGYQPFSTSVDVVRPAPPGSRSRPSRDRRPRIRSRHPSGGCKFVVGPAGEHRLQLRTRWLAPSIRGFVAAFQQQPVLTALGVADTRQGESTANLGSLQPERQMSIVNRLGRRQGCSSTLGCGPNLEGFGIGSIIRCRTRHKARRPPRHGPKPSEQTASLRSGKHHRVGSRLPFPSKIWTTAKTGTLGKRSAAEATARRRTAAVQGNLRR